MAVRVLSLSRSRYFCLSSSEGWPGTFRTALTLLFVLLTVSPLSVAQGHRSIPEEIEWTWEVRPSHPDPKLPNVLLLGDSITRNYYPGVVHGLDGRANVYLFATSAPVSDPRLSDEIKQFYAMEAVRFSVVHFNNGMHGWATVKNNIGKLFPAFSKWSGTSHQVEDSFGPPQPL